MKRITTKAELKRTSDIIKLVKTVYGENIFISNASEPMNVIAEPLKYESTNPIFQRSYFVNVVDRMLPELQESIVNINAIYEALKLLKIEGIDVDDDNGNISFFDDQGMVQIGVKVNPTRYNELYAEVTGRMNDYYTAMQDGNHLVGTVSCESTVIDRLINYDTVTVRNDIVQDVGIILTAKCFPNIKKCQAIQIDWLVHGDDEMVPTMVTSSYMDGIIFRMQVGTLRC